MSVPYPNWDPPPPLPPASVSPPNQRGRGHTRLRVRGWGVPTRLLEKKPSAVLCVYSVVYNSTLISIHFILEETLPHTWPWFLFPFLNFNLWAHKTNCNWLNAVSLHLRLLYFRIYMFLWGFGILPLLDIVFSLFLQSIPQITGKLKNIWFFQFFYSSRRNIGTV